MRKSAKLLQNMRNDSVFTIYKQLRGGKIDTVTIIRQVLWQIIRFAKAHRRAKVLAILPSSTFSV